MTLLTITHPTHNQCLVGPAEAQVTFKAVITDPPAVPLYYKWYASLDDAALRGVEVTADKPDVALNSPNFGPDALVGTNATLRVGSNVITLVAKDQIGETLPELQALQHVYMAGGPPAAPAPCVVHVFVATSTSVQVNWFEVELAAEAPAQWWNSDYRKINRIQFCWRFEPRDGGAPVATIPASPAQMAAFQDALRFDRKTGWVWYRGPRPAALAAGVYRLILRVEDHTCPEIGAEMVQFIRILG